MEIILSYTDNAGNKQEYVVNGNELLIRLIREIGYMIDLYGNKRYTQAEALRDKLAEKLDDIMKLGNNN